VIDILDGSIVGDTAGNVASNLRDYTIFCNGAASIKTVPIPTDSLIVVTSGNNEANPINKSFNVDDYGFTMCDVHTIILYDTNSKKTLHTINLHDPKFMDYPNAHLDYVTNVMASKGIDECDMIYECFAKDESGCLYIMEIDYPMKLAKKDDVVMNVDDFMALYGI